MTGPVKVFQIKGVVPHLIDCLTMKRAFTDLEFQDKDATSGKNDRIDPAPDTRNIEFKTEITIDPPKGLLKDLNFIFPGSGLSRSNGKDPRA